MDIMHGTGACAGNNHPQLKAQLSKGTSEGLYFVRASGVQAAVSGGGLHDKLGRGVALPADPDDVPLDADLLGLPNRGGVAFGDLDGPGCAPSKRRRTRLRRAFGRRFGA